MGVRVLSLHYRRAVETFRYGGTARFLWWALCRLLSPVGKLDIMTYYERDLTEPVVEVPARAPVEVTQATEDDLDHLVALIGEYRGIASSADWDSLQTVRRDALARFRRGDKCFVAKGGGRIVHSNWIVFDTMQFLPLRGYERVLLGEGEAYTTDGYTLQPWRGKGVHTAVNGRMLRFLQERGYRKAYTQARAENRSSRTGLDPLGWWLTGVVLHFIPRLRSGAIVWRVRGTLRPFSDRPGRVLFFRPGT